MKPEKENIEGISMHGGTLMKERSDNQAPNPFTRKWLLVVILCMVPLFFLFAFLGDPGRGRAVAICLGVTMTALRACWNLKRYPWFWMVLAVIVALHVLLVLSVHWNDKSYPGYTLLPFAVLNYGVVYGCFKLIEAAVKRSYKAE
jgi:hypothetical protein